MHTPGAGPLYFALVFGAGFILGVLRVLWLSPRLGERTAELIEAPLMLAVIILAARWVVGRFSIPATVLHRLSLGFTALGLLLAAEFGGVLWLRGMSLVDYFSSRDSVALTVYIVMLGLFTIMPLLVRRS